MSALILERNKAVSILMSRSDPGLSSQSPRSIDMNALVANRGALPLRKRTLFAAALVALIVAFLFLTAGSLIIGNKSFTYDELDHLRYGEQIYSLNSDRFDDSKMPFSVLNVIPSKVIENSAIEEFLSRLQVMSSGRLSTIAFSLGVGLICLAWAWKLYGMWAGLVAFGLYVLEPNLIAHSRLITTDIYAAGTITLALYLFWRFGNHPSFLRGGLAALALGIAQIAKYSAIMLYPILLLLIVVRYWPTLTKKMRGREYAAVGRSLSSFLAYGFLFLFISVVVVNIGFLFNRTGTPFGEYDFRSSRLQAIQAQSASLSSIPIPIPYPYLEGLDWVIYNERTGENHGGIYLFGEISNVEGFPGYFLIASLFKVPLPILVIFAISISDWLKSFRAAEFRRNEMYLLIPALVYAIYFNFFFKAQIGIRFFFVIFPILLIFSARIFRKWDLLPRATRFALPVIGIYLVASVLSYFPHYLSYFNELVVDRKQAYKVLADSNNDWGQNQATLGQFLAKNPDYVFEPEGPVPGFVVVGVNALTGVLGGPDQFRWLREAFEPVDHLNYTYLIYELSASDLGK